MTNSTLITQEELKDTSPAERDLLYQRYGFSPGDIQVLAQAKNNLEKVHTISKAIIQKSKELNERGRLDNRKIGSQITLATIGGILRNPWDGKVKYATTNVRSFLSGRYEKHHPNMQLTSTHGLRKELGVYSGNLESALNEGYDFYASEYDLRESIVLPLSIGFKVGVVMGIAKAEAKMVSIKQKPGENSGKSKYLQFCGSDYWNEFGLYKVLDTLLKTEFNYCGDITRENNGISLHVGSSAISTWICGRFPLTDQEYNPTQIETLSTEAQMGYFSGYAAAKGKVREGRKLIRIFSRNEALLVSLENIATNNGIPIRISIVEKNKNCPFLDTAATSDTYCLSILSGGVVMMYNQKLLINPEHLSAYSKVQK